MSTKLEHGEYRVWPLVNGQRKSGPGSSCDVLRADCASHAARLAAKLVTDTDKGLVVALGKPKLGPRPRLDKRTQRETRA